VKKILFLILLLCGVAQATPSWHTVYIREFVGNNQPDSEWRDTTKCGSVAVYNFGETIAGECVVFPTGMAAHTKLRIHIEGTWTNGQNDGDEMTLDDDSLEVFIGDSDDDHGYLALHTPESTPINSWFEGDGTGDDNEIIIAKGSQAETGDYFIVNRVAVEIYGE
jgi:hypothetical protein